MTAHYIHAPANAPKKWELKTEQLAFKSIEGQHTGPNMANILINSAIDQYDIQGKVLT